MGNLEAKIVVITGASAGVGRATAYEFATAGAQVVLLARDQKSLKAVEQKVNSLGGMGYSFSLDVADPEKMYEAAEFTENKIGPVDFWINNAMTSVFSPFKEMRPDEFKRVTEVTYLGQAYGTMAALKYMLPRNRGKIILVGSALAYRGIPLQSAYCGAKHGIQGFFDSLRSELIHDKSKVQLSMVELPALNTPQFNWVKSRLTNKARPMGTVFQPEVAGRAIKYAALHNKREIFVAMPTFEAILGNKFFPGLLDWILAKRGYKGQQTNESEDINRKYNLWETVSALHQTHGRFDNIAKSTSPMLWMSTHWRLVWFIIFLIILIVYLVL